MYYEHNRRTSIYRLDFLSKASIVSIGFLNKPFVPMLTTIVLVEGFAVGPLIGENFSAMQLSNTSVSIRKELKSAQCNLFAQYP